MPIVLTQNEVTESGHEYADVIGLSYEYPTRYAGLIRAGERFVYYKGRRRIGGGTGPQAYLGIGTIGPIMPSPRDDRLLVCRILGYSPFPDPLPFRDASGYLERRANDYANPGLFFRSGVRAVSEAEFQHLIRLGFGDSAGPDDAEQGAPEAVYASKETLREIDAVAMDLAAAEARARFGDAEVMRMPHNNPGFDILIRQHSGDSYVEVKGTTRSAPVFFLSEGERRFSIANSDRYLLWVFFGLDVSSRTGTLAEHRGAIEREKHELVPRQWAGRIRGVEPGRSTRTAPQHPVE